MMAGWPGGWFGGWRVRPRVWALVWPRGGLAGGNVPRRVAWVGERGLESQKRDEGNPLSAIEVSTGQVWGLRGRRWGIHPEMMKIATGAKVVADLREGDRGWAAMRGSR